MKQKYIIFLGFYFIFLNSILSQIVNEGTLQIKPSTTVYFGDEYTNKTTATHNNDGDLHLNSNFINNGATTSTSGTTFFESASVQSILGSTNEINFYNLEINNSSLGVSVVDNFGLFVTNAITLTSGDLRLVGEAQLVQDNDVANSGSGKLLKDQKGYASAFRYNHWSSPVNNGGTFSLNGGLFDGTDSAINPFSPQQILFNSGSPYNGKPSVVVGDNVTEALTINERWLYTYSPNATGYSGWDKKTKDSSINPTEGFLMKGTNTLSTTQNYVFKGVPNNGDYSSETVVAGQSVLLGNPYPSALDCDEFILDNMSSPPDSRATSNTIDGTLSFWVEGGSSSHYLSEYLGGYATRNLAGGVPASVPPSGISGIGDANNINKIPEKYMAVAQGFFVDAIGGGEIVFKNSQRVFKTESSTESVFLKAATNTLKSTIRIGHEDPEGFHRQLALVFMPESYADLDFNMGYDAIMTSVREDDIFFIIEDDLDKKYVIQGVGAYDNSYEFPLGLIITEEGEHTIMLDAVENFSETVYIKDVVLDTIYNLSAANFIPSLPAGEYLNRFKLVFKPKEEIAEEEDQIEEENLKVYYNNNNVLISNKSDLKLNNVLIFNILGQKLKNVSTNLLLETEIAIPFAYKKGIYLIVVITDQGRMTYKIIN